MRIQIFCFSLLILTVGMVYAAEQQEKKAPVTPSDFSLLANLPDFELAQIVATLPYSALGRFEQVSRRFAKIAQVEFKNRLGDMRGPKAK